MRLLLAVILCLPLAAQLKDPATCLADYDPDTRTWATSDRAARRAARMTGDGFATCAGAPNNGWQTRWSNLTVEQRKDEIWDNAWLPWYQSLSDHKQDALDDAINTKMTAVDPGTYPDPDAITQPQRKAWAKEQFFVRAANGLLEWVEGVVIPPPSETTYIVARTGPIANKLLNKVVLFPAIDGCCPAVWIGTQQSVEGGDGTRRMWAVPTLPEEQEDYLWALLVAEGSVMGVDVEILSAKPGDWIE